MLVLQVVAAPVAHAYGLVQGCACLTTRSIDGHSWLISWSFVPVLTLKLFTLGWQKKWYFSPRHLATFWFAPFYLLHNQSLDFSLKLTVCHQNASEKPTGGSNHSYLIILFCRSNHLQSYSESMGQNLFKMPDSPWLVLGEATTHFIMIQIRKQEVILRV